MEPIRIIVRRIPWPFPSWVQAVTIWPFIFMEEEVASNPCIWAHEEYHYRQQGQWLVLPWFVAYFALGLVYLGKPANQHPMEKSAYAAQHRCNEAQEQKREPTNTSQDE